MRVKRNSPRTEKTYCYSIRYFIRHHGVRHPASMGPSEIQAFLERLTVAGYATAATKPSA
ncbi:phage integrase N-terminal SAM-like domain-containing protein [Vreelandella sp. F11]|uniref:phage integrase N-terminal SAM-like domain-containing protein n=1 Tax=Vreelandella sp. F11 TaxID=3394751 RepID=UPI0036DB2755